MTEQVYRVPTGKIDKLSVEPATLGGGFIMTLVTEGRVETVVFSEYQALTRYMLVLFNMSTLAQPDAVAHEAPSPSQTAPKVEANTLRKGRGGRPKGAKNKPKVVAKDLNGAQPPVEANETPVEQPAQEAA